MAVNYHKLNLPKTSSLLYSAENRANLWQTLLKYTVYFHKWSKNKFSHIPIIIAEVEICDKFSLIVIFGNTVSNIGPSGFYLFSLHISAWRSLESRLDQFCFQFYRLKMTSCALKRLGLVVTLLTFCKTTLGQNNNSISSADAKQRCNFYYVYPQTCMISTCLCNNLKMCPECVACHIRAF